MAGVVSISGLATGMDTKSIVSQLMAIERLPETSLIGTKTTMQNQIDVYTPLQTALSNLQTLMASMNTPSTFAAQTASVSDSTVATTTASSTAAPGIHDLAVTNLAKSQRQVSANGVASTTDLNFNTGQFIIRGGASDTVVTIGEGSNSLSGMAAAINASGANVTASIINDGSSSPYRLVLSSKDTNNYVLDMNAGATTSDGKTVSTGLTTAPAQPTTGTSPYSNPLFKYQTSSSTATSGSYTSATDQSLGTGTVTVDGTDIAIDGTNNSLNGIRDAINNAKGSTTAAVVQDGNGGYQLQLSKSGIGSIAVDMSGLTGGSGAGATNPTFTSVTPAAQTSNWYASTSAQSFGVGNITIDGTDVAIDSTNNSLTGIAAAINSAKGSSTAAKIISDGSGYRLQLSGVGTVDMSNLVGATGSYANPTFSAIDPTKAPANDATYSAGVNANFSLDGVNISKSTNAVSDVLTGVTFTLLKGSSTDATTGMATPATSTLTIGNDTSTITSKINNFVTSYNDIMGIINKQSVYDTTKSTSAPLFGDSTLRGIKDAMRTMISGPVTDATAGTVNQDYSLLSKIGITSNSKDGTLSVDSTILATALNTNFSAVTDLFTHNGGGKIGITDSNQYGIAERFNLQLDKYTAAYIGSGGDNGIIATRINGLQKSMTNVDDQVTRMEMLLTMKEDNLNKQFVSMETLVSGITSSGNAMLSSLSSMPRFG